MSGDLNDDNLVDELDLHILMTRSVPWDDENVNQLNNIIENWRDGYVPEPEAEPEPEIESQELTGFTAINEDCLLYTSPSPRD